MKLIEFFSLNERIKLVELIAAPSQYIVTIHYIKNIHTLLL